MKPQKIDFITIVPFALAMLLLGLMIGIHAAKSAMPVQPVDDGTLIQRMKATCEESYKVIDGELEQRCGALQDELALRGYETLTKGDGQFWVEK